MVKLINFYQSLSMCGLRNSFLVHSDPLIFIALKKTTSVNHKLLLFILHAIVIINLCYQLSFFIFKNAQNFNFNCKNFPFVLQSKQFNRPGVTVIQACKKIHYVPQRLINGHFQRF